ncbi:hypothetical protein HRbin29_01017 [bacterium HR29]|mgnify:CR=1 FL=1|nr:hypothetical protein HRbin29_01017 [bacterium HR29]
METVIAGWVAGYAMALVSTTVGALALTRGAAPKGWTEAGVPPGVVGVLVSVGAVFFWTIVGLTAAIVYAVGDFAGRPGAGSESLPFALGSVGLALAGAAPVAALFPRWRWAVALHAAAFAGLFGWALPWMAAQ